MLGQMPDSAKRGNTMKQILMILMCLPLLFGNAFAEDRPRARDAGLIVGVFPPGKLNAHDDPDLGSVFNTYPELHTSDTEW